MAGTFDISRTDLLKHLRDLINLGDARRPKGDSIFVRRVSRRLSNTEELGGSPSLSRILQPVGNVHVFGKAESGQEYAVELSNRTEVRNAQIDVIEAMHIRFQLSARPRSSDRLALSVPPCGEKLDDPFFRPALLAR